MLGSDLSCYFLNPISRFLEKARNRITEKRIIICQMYVSYEIVTCPIDKTI